MKIIKAVIFSIIENIYKMYAFTNLNKIDICPLLMLFMLLILHIVGQKLKFLVSSTDVYNVSIVVWPYSI